MPDTFTFTDYLETSGNTVNLLSGDLKLVTGSFTDEVNDEERDKVLSFHTIATGTTEGEARDAITTLERVLHKIKVFTNDKTSAESIWLKAATDSETARRTLLKKWNRKDVNTRVHDSLMEQSAEILSQWTLERAAYWEALPADFVTRPVYYLESSGQEIDYDSLVTTNEFGTAGCRIKEFRPGCSGMNKYWIGIKPDADHDGDASTKFFRETENSRELYDGWVGTTDDANASPTTPGTSNVTVVDFTGSGANAFENRFQNNIPVWNEGSIRGTYLILLRARLNSAGTVRMAMFHAWDYIDNIGVPADTYQDVYLSSQEWHLYEMGIVQLPPESYRQARRDRYGALGNNRFGLAAELLTGTAGTVDLLADYWMMIPMEHHMALDQINNSAHGSAATQVITDEEGEINAYTYDYGTTWETKIAQASPLNWWFPSGYGQRNTYVAAADKAIGDGHHPLTTTAAGTLYLVPRYYSYNAD